MNSDNISALLFVILCSVPTICYTIYRIVKLIYTQKTIIEYVKDDEPKEVTTNADENGD